MCVLASIVSASSAALVACGGSPSASNTNELGGLTGPTKGGAWVWQSDVKGPYSEDTLRAVWAASSDDAWAVGGGALHWDGKSWKSVAVPTLQDLYAVWGSASDDVWAVGGGLNDPGHDANLIHWDGKRWSTSASGTPDNLSGIWGSGPDDVWAVGSSGVEGVITHFDGHKWTIAYKSDVEFPQSISGSAASDVWAVGFYNEPSGGSMVLHYDGTSWSNISNKGLTQELLGVWTSDSTHAWAVGIGSPAEWNGTKWSNVSSKNLIALSSVWGTGNDNVWVVGNFKHTVIANYNGTSWKQWASAGASLYGVGGADKDHLWAVGDKTTILRFDSTVSGAVTCADIAGSCGGLSACAPGKGHVADYACGTATDTCCVVEYACGGTEPSCCTPSGAPAGRPHCNAGAFVCEGSEFCPLPP